MTDKTIIRRLISPSFAGEYINCFKILIHWTMGHSCKMFLNELLLSGKDGRRKSGLGGSCKFFIQF